MSAETAQSASGRWAFPLTLALAIGMPVGCAVMWPTLLRALAVGAASWAVAVGVKHAVARTARAREVQRAGAWGAAAWGSLSGVLELGALAAAFGAGLMPATVAHGVAAGIGAAALEVFYLVTAGIASAARETPAPEGAAHPRAVAWEGGARRSWIVANMLLVERVVAGVVHVGTRGLVAGSIAGAGMVPAIVALLTFTAVDGVATYGAAHGWNWFEPQVAGRYYLFVLLAGAGNLALLALAA